MMVLLWFRADIPSKCVCVCCMFLCMYPQQSV